jgi:hypothetical protein
MVASFGFCLLTFVLIASTFAKEPVNPAGALAPAGPDSPGILAGGYLYVSGQRARAGDGEIPSDSASQVRQTLDNVKAIVEAAGLTLDHVVYTRRRALLYALSLAVWTTASLNSPD